MDSAGCATMTARIWPPWMYPPPAGPHAWRKASAAGPPSGAGYSVTLRSLSELETTDTELRLIAAPAIIGLRTIPKCG